MNAKSFVKLSVVAVAVPLFLAGCPGGGGGGGGGGPGGGLISVAKLGGGQGSVISAPAGINCGVDCVQSFSSGTTVTLTATADPGSSLVGWSGVTAPGAACAASYPAGTTTGTCLFTVHGSENVVATFAPNTSAGTLGEMVALDGANELISFNRATPNNVQTRGTLIGLGAGDNAVGLTRRQSDNQLYALVKGTTSSRLAAVSVADPIHPTITSSATLTNSLFVPTVLAGSNFGMDFDPHTGLLRIVSDAGENLSVDPTPVSGNVVVTTDTALNGAVTAAAAAAYTNNYSNAAGTVLVLMQGSKLVVQNPQSSGTTALQAALDVTVSDVSGLEITTDSSDSDLNTVVFLAGTESGCGCSKLFKVNITSGVTTFMGTVGTGADTIRSLVMPRATQQATLGDTLLLTNDGRVMSVNHSASSGVVAFRTSVQVLGLVAGEKLIGMDHRATDGVLYAVGDKANAGNLYTIDTDSGLATLVHSLSAALSGSDFGMSFKPTTDQIRIVSNTGQNIVVDPTNGTVTAMTGLSRDGAAPFPAPRNGAGATASAFDPALAGVAGTTHYVLDTASDVLATVREAAALPDVNNNPQGELVNIGPLGVDAAANNGFDVDPITRTAYAALNVSSENGLYTIDLGTGAATKVGVLGSGTVAIGGLALRPPTGPFIFAVINDSGQKLVKFSPTYPGTYLPFTKVIGTPTELAISGLGSGNVLDLDFHVINGVEDVLYALVRDGTADKIYIIDTDTGAATLQTTLAASVDDPTSPYVAPLGGTVFGIDFSPTTALSAAALRVVSDANQNVRVNVVNGEVFTDTTLSLNGAPSPSMKIAGLAFINNVPAAASTTAYVIDTNGGDQQGRLGILGVDPNPMVSTTNPANGSVGYVDSSGSTQLTDPVFDQVAIVQGSRAPFDIIGPDDLLPFAAIKIGDQPGTTNPRYVLYRIDLSGATGTQVGTIGDGSKDVLGMAIQLEPLGN